MSDLSLILEGAGSMLVVATGGVAAVWKHLTDRIKTLDDRCEELEARWAKEVRRGVMLALLPPPPVESPKALPSPDWEEKTDVRNVRAAIERDELLRKFLESTPPGSLPPMRPRLKSHRDK